MSSTDSTELREQLEEFALHMKPGTTKGKHRTAIFDTVKLTNFVQHIIAERELAAEIAGMAKAKSRVLRLTEIPADAKNPTRDAIVILGEDIANIIGRDIAVLRTQRSVGGDGE